MAAPTPVIPPVAALLNPITVLTATFNPDGTITVTQSVSQDGGVTYPPATQIGSFDASKITIGFEFVVDPGADPKSPQSGLLVERYDNWDNPWDDELAHVLGGLPFPYGTAPLPPAGNADWSVLPRNSINGVFSGPLALGGGSQLVMLGINGSSTSSLPGGGPIKYLSLWLPKGATGSVNISLPGKSVKTFSTKTKPKK